MGFVRRRTQPRQHPQRSTHKRHRKPFSLWRPGATNRSIDPKVSLMIGSLICCLLIVAISFQRAKEQNSNSSIHLAGGSGQEGNLRAAPNAETLISKEVQTEVKTNLPLQLHENNSYERPERPPTWSVHEERQGQPDESQVTLPSVSDLVFSVESKDSLRPFLERGPHFIRADSGCEMARWVWTAGIRRFSDCVEAPREKVLDYHLSEIQSLDTIYVPIPNLDTFVHRALPELKVAVILITGTVHASHKIQIPEEIFDAIVDVGWIRLWFCQNMQAHLPEKIDIISYPKLHPFPYGIAFPASIWDNVLALDYDPAAVFREAFLDHLEDYENTDAFNTLKTIAIWKNTDELNAMNPHHDNYRWAINGQEEGDEYGHDQIKPKQDLIDYYSNLASSKFAIIPTNGRRNEHSRVFEALALGTIPVTSWATKYHKHLKEGPVVLEQQLKDLNVYAVDSYLTDFEREVKVQHLSDPFNPNQVLIRRRLIMEEYWMLHVESLFGKPVRWWDRLERQPAFLTDFLNFPFVKEAHGAG